MTWKKRKLKRHPLPLDFRLHLNFYVDEFLFGETVQKKVQGGPIEKNRVETRPAKEE